MESSHFLFLSIVLFVCSLSQRTYCIDSDCGERWSGLMCLLVGVFGLFSCRAGLTWLANPLLFYAWINFSEYGPSSCYTSLAALLIGLSFLLRKSIIKDEGGNYGTITGYRAGYWLWLASMAVAVLATLVDDRLSRTAMETTFGITSLFI